MKTLGKIKLNEFRKAELEKRKMNTLKGGCFPCKCGCVSVGIFSTSNENDGSSTAVAY